MLQDKDLTDKRLKLELEQEDIKEKLSSTSEDLDMRVRCYRETQMSASQRNSAIRGEDTQVRMRRRAEILCSHTCLEKFLEDESTKQVRDQGITRGSLSTWRRAARSRNITSPS